MIPLPHVDWQGDWLWFQHWLAHDGGIEALPGWQNRIVGLLLVGGWLLALFLFRTWWQKDVLDCDSDLNDGPSDRPDNDLRSQLSSSSSSPPSP